MRFFSVKPFVNQETLRKFYFSYVHSIFITLQFSLAVHNIVIVFLRCKKIIKSCYGFNKYRSMLYIIEAMKYPPTEITVYVFLIVIYSQEYRIT